MKKSILKAAKTFAVALAGILLFTGCNKLYSDLQEPVFSSESYFRSASSPQNVKGIKNNIIYTRSLKYISNPEYYTHICLYSLKVTDGVGTVNEKSFSDKFSKSDIKKFKASYPNVKLLLCVGGGTSEQETTIYESLLHDQSSFINTLVRIMNDYGLDGIDIDWEYFSSSRSKIYNPIYRSFMKNLRSVMGSNKTLSMAVVDYDPFLDSDSAYIFNNYADVVSIMCYAPHDFETAKSFIWKYDNLINDRSKIAVGLPYYGKYASESNPNATSFSKNAVKSSMDYNDLVAKFGESAIEKNCNYKQDKTVAYFYNSGKLYMFANKVTTKNREQWIIDNGFNGFMVWAADGDPEGNLQSLTYEMVKANPYKASNGNNNSSKLTPLRMSFETMPTIVSSFDSSVNGAFMFQKNSSGQTHIKESRVSESTGSYKMKILDGRYTVDIFIRYINVPENAKLSFKTMVNTENISEISKIEELTSSGSKVNSLISSNIPLTAVNANEFQEINTAVSLSNTSGWIHLQYMTHNAKESESIYIDDVVIK